MGQTLCDDITEVPGNEKLHHKQKPAKFVIYYLHSNRKFCQQLNRYLAKKHFQTLKLPFAI